MGIIRNNFFFISGTAFGIYIAQNYNVPNVRKTIEKVLFKAKDVEEKYRKPTKPGE